MAKNQGSTGGTSTTSKPAPKPLTQEEIAKREARKAEKAANFKRLATNRTQKALKALRMVEQCSNRNTYSYTPEEAQKIVSALSEAVVSIRNSFANVKEEEQSFTL